jgi:hypothetical protein|uniref:hypothetical protein n=1 Tax=Trichocoleus desertorum TaxID=1481672 RepID=UPI0025B39659|nr:hypothetical protein [Trichocoleus desertorum]
MSDLKLEQEIERMALAMMIRNTQVGRDLIANLKSQLTLIEVAGVLLVSFERLIGFDTDAFFWAVEHLVPADVMAEIRRITSPAIYQRLIGKGFLPGRDISVTENGQLLLNERAKTVLSPCCLVLI